MLLYLKDILELKVLLVSLMTYRKEQYSKKYTSDALIELINDLIDKIDKEVEYYDPTTQEN